jgi:hypothetical protein
MVAEQIVPVTTLARVCEDHITGEIDFLKVDVEGHEREVLEGADWSRWRPRVVVVEAVRPTLEPSHQAWESILLRARYEFVAFDGVNRYYARREEPVLAEALRDAFSIRLRVAVSFRSFLGRHPMAWRVANAYREATGWPR